MSKTEIEPEPSGTPGPPLADCMHRVLADPLAALRASMEALIQDLGAEAPHGPRLEGALDQITRLAGDVQSLVELAEPRVLAPLSCSLDELARSAVARLRPHQRARVRYAHPSASPRMWVDGPTLTGAIASLLAEALEISRGEVLLRSRQHGGRSAFVIVHATRARAQERDLRMRPDAAARAVRLAVARRDIARMGGAVTMLGEERRASCVCIELPDRADEQHEERAA